MANQQRKNTFMTSNRVTLIGYVGRTTFRYSDNGVPRANFSVGTHKLIKDQETGEPSVVTHWHNVVAFRGRAQILDRAVRGDTESFRVAIEGRLNERNYQDPNYPKLPNGKPNLRYVTEVVVNDVQFLGPMHFAPVEDEDNGEGVVEPEGESIPIEGASEGSDDECLF